MWRVLFCGGDQRPVREGDSQELTDVQRQVQTQHVRSREQLLEPDVLRPGPRRRVQRLAVVVDDLHAERACLLRHVPPDAPHAQDAEHLALGIVAQRRGGRASPLAGAQSRHRPVEASQRAQHEEDGRVGGGGVDGGRDIGDAQRGRAGGAGVDVDLVVAGAVVGAEGQRLRQGVDQRCVLRTIVRQSPRQRARAPVGGRLLAHSPVMSTDMNVR